MKKIILLTPLMALTALTSCGAKPIDVRKIDLYKKSTKYGSDGTTVLSITNYEYNDHDLMSKSVAINAMNEEKYVMEKTYDEHENLIYQKDARYHKVEDIEPYSTRVEKSTITYDGQNRISCIEIERTTDEDIRKTQEKYEYLDKKKIAKMSRYDSDSQQYELIYTLTYTYNDQGLTTNIRKEHAPRQNAEAFGYEEKYTLDEHGCAIKIEHYLLDEDYHITENMESLTTTTYLDNLYYRPLKEITEHYSSDGTLKNTAFVECEYNKDKKITLHKEYNVTANSHDAIHYTKYITYEY